jgi:hypothetical protein
MFSGSIIDELMAAVDRAEENAEAEVGATAETYCMLVPEYRGGTSLAGVA